MHLCLVCPFFPGSTSVVPVIGLIKNYDAKNLEPNSEEVCDFFTKGVYDLHNPKVAGYTQFRIPDRPGYSLPIYNCQPYPIWGMTAIITYQFLSVFLKGRTLGFRHKLSFQTPLNFASKSKRNWTYLYVFSLEIKLKFILRWNAKHYHISYINHPTIRRNIFQIQ